MKQFNRQKNMEKNIIFMAEAKKQGKSRSRRKRAAEADPDAESSQDAAQDAARAPQAEAWAADTGNASSSNNSHPLRIVQPSDLR